MKQEEKNMRNHSNKEILRESPFPCALIEIYNLLSKCVDGFRKINLLLLYWGFDFKLLFSVIFKNSSAMVLRKSYENINGILSVVNGHRKNIVPNPITLRIYSVMQK